jgi:hypothetical protein
VWVYACASMFVCAYGYARESMGLVSGGRGFLGGGRGLVSAHTLKVCLHPFVSLKFRTRGLVSAGLSLKYRQRFS